MSSQSIGGNGDSPAAPPADSAGLRTNGRPKPDSAPAYSGRALYSTLAWAAPKLARVTPVRRTAVRLVERKLRSWIPHPVV